MTLQNQSNQILSTLSGVTTQETSSYNTAHKTGVECENKANIYDCIYTTVYEQCRLLQLICWCVYQHIIYTLLATVKLFCLVGWDRKYNSQFIGKYLSLGSFLVVNLPINLTKQNEVLINAK